MTAAGPFDHCRLLILRPFQRAISPILTEFPRLHAHTGIGVRGVSTRFHGFRAGFGLVSVTASS